MSDMPCDVDTQPTHELTQENEGGEHEQAVPHTEVHDTAAELPADAVVPSERSAAAVDTPEAAASSSPHPQEHAVEQSSKVHNSSSDDSVCADNQDTAAAKLQEDAADLAAEVLPTRAAAQHTAAASEQELQGNRDVTEEHGEQDVEHIAEPEERHQQADRLPAAAAAAETPGYPAATVSSAGSKGLTFSGPPYVPTAKPYKRVDYSHSKVSLMKIAHDNQLLVQHLTTISKAAPKGSSSPPALAPGNIASSAVNRRKQAAVIAQENHALYQRLVAIRPSKDISRETLESEHRQNELYKTNCAHYKPTAAAGGAHQAAATT